jgi:hypothetical protein
MPSRKQRRRREKAFRHEYGFVTYDEDGNEVEVDSTEIRPEKPQVERAKPTPTGRGGRPLREPPTPSWRRSLRRGGIWGGLMFVVLVFFLPGTGSPASRVMIGLLYAAAFVPLTYWIDRLAYRNYLRRSGKT